jgi:beta-galactosidase/beta-glucuronidase
LPEPTYQPAFQPSQRAEITHNVRRLHQHPSIVMWTGGNEFRNTPQFADAVQVDWVPMLPSSY